MTDLIEHSNEEQLMLTNRRMPGLEVLRRLAPRVPRELRPPADIWGHEETAYSCIMTLLARRLAWHRGRGKGRREPWDQLRLETVVLAPTEPELPEWAAAERHERLVVHRVPAYCEGHPVPLLFDEVYRSTRRRYGVELQGQEVPPAAVEAGRLLLNDCRVRPEHFGLAEFLAAHGYRVWSYPRIGRS